MDKNIIKQYLAKTFLSEEVVPGISVTNASKKKSAKANKDGIKDIEKKVGDFEKSVKKDPNSKQIPPNKFNYDIESEKTYHDQMEIMNGQEMINYSSEPDKRFKERALEAIEGSSNMGNNPEWANVIPKQQGFTGPEFGKNLVKNIKASTKKRNEAEKGIFSFGDDIENETRNNLKNTKFSALSESIDEMATPIKPISEKNKMVLTNWIEKFGPKISAEKLINTFSQTGMVSEFPDSIEYGEGLNKITDLLLKKDFDKAVHIAKKLAIKLEKKAMKDMGMFENKYNDKTQIKESMKRLKFKNPFNGVGNALKLIPEGYRVNNKEFEMTDGNETYKIRWEGNLSEGKAVVLTASDKKLVNEDITRMKELFGYKSHETLGNLKGKERLDENKIFGDIWSKTKSLMTETEDMEGADAKEGNWDEETKKATEATKHVEGSTKKDATIAKGKESNLDKVVKHAPEAKNPVKSSKGTNIETDADVTEGTWESAAKAQAPEAKKHVHLKEEKEEQEEGWMKNEAFDVESAEFMNEDEFGNSYTDDAENQGADGDYAKAMDSVSDEEVDDSEEASDDSNWAKSDDDDSDEKEPDFGDIKSVIPTDIDDDDDDLESLSTPSIEGMDFKLLSNGRGDFQIMVKGETIDVPNDEIYTSIAMDKSLKAVDRAEKIYDEMKKYGDI